MSAQCRLAMTRARSTVLALSVADDPYNRGPGRVNQIVAEGGDPSNGYENAVLRGYQPKRVTPAMQQRAKELGT